MKTTMLVLALTVFGFAGVAQAQTQDKIETDCRQVWKDGPIDCTSEVKPDPAAAAAKAAAERRAEDVRRGQTMERQLDALDAAWANHRLIKKYCKQHPGESWTTTDQIGQVRNGTCPAAKVKTVPRDPAITMQKEADDYCEKKLGKGWVAIGLDDQNPLSMRCQKRP